MDIYHNRKKVLEFKYREVEIIVVEATKGASCCEQDHRPTAKTCPKCGQPLKHELVTLILSKGTILLTLPRVTKLRAKREAQELIDRVCSNQDKKSPPGKNGAGKKAGSGKRRRPPPKRRRPKLPPGEDEDIGEFPAPPPGFSLGEGEDDIPVDNEAALIELTELMKELGWGERVAQMLDELKNKKDSG